MQWKNGNDLTLAMGKDGKPLVMTADQRSTHLHIPGLSNTGKTRFLEYLIQQDIDKWSRSKCGLLLFDVTGSLYDNLMRWSTSNQHIFQGRPIVPIDLRQDDWITVYNILRKRDKIKADVVANEFTKAIAFVWGRSGTNTTPRFSRIASTVLQSLYEAGRPISEAYDILTFRFTKLREELAQSASNRAVAKNLRDMNAQREPEFDIKAESTINGFERLVRNELLRTSFSTPGASFDFGRAMDEGWIVLVSLSRAGGKISEEEAHTFGTLMLSDLWNAAYERGKETADWQPKPFYVYIDEFQNFLTPTIAANLEEARGYGLHLTLAHQAPSQLIDASPEFGKRIYSTVMNQAQTKVVFTNESSEPEDAPALASWLFKGTVNLKRVKQEIYQRKVTDYKEETRKIRGKGTTDTDGEQQGRNRGRGTGAAHMDGGAAGLVLTTAFDQDGVAAAYPTQAASEIATFADVFSAMETEGETEGTSSSRAKSTSESTVPVFLPIFSSELASRELMSVADQLFEAEQALFLLKKREAFVRLAGSKVPVAMRTAEVPAATAKPKRVEEFRQRCLSKWDFAIPKEQALTLIREAAIRLAGAPPEEDDDATYETTVATGDKMKAHDKKEGDR